MAEFKGKIKIKRPWGYETSDARRSKSKKEAQQKRQQLRQIKYEHQSED